VSAACCGAAASGFDASRALVETVVSFLDGAEAAALSHAELAERLDTDGRALLRRLLADHLELRAHREARVEVVDAGGVARGRVESGPGRALATVFGEVEVHRLAYRAPGQANLHPADGGLNLPEEKHSHGLRRLAAVEAARGSFDEAAGAVERATGDRLGKRQVEELTARTAVDFDDFYATRKLPPAADPGDVLALSADGKGIVMRPEALRPATARAAAKTSPKLATRLSKGEKRNRKRMAELGAVYDAAPVVRTPADILPDCGANRAEVTAGPTASNKWLTASVVEEAASVVPAIFDEAERRDPNHTRAWVALVDGANHQIDRIRAEAKTRGVEVSIICDFIHVLEYVWKAAWCFYPEADPAAEAWVRHQALAVLDGKATQVAGVIRRKATTAGLDRARRKSADEAASYLTKKARYLDYPTALNNGWPIATGVIEGACRHIVADRLDITGARWGLEGAEAILKLRALRSNKDFHAYWQYHLAQERRRVHESRYANSIIPQAA